jgi:hypothetical protein
VLVSAQHFVHNRTIFDTSVSEGINSEDATGTFQQQ